MKQTCRTCRLALPTTAYYKRQGRAELDCKRCINERRAAKRKEKGQQPKISATDGQKRCKVCTEAKPIEQFSRDGRRGFKSICKRCDAAKQMRKYAAVTCGQVESFGNSSTWLRRKII